MDMRHLGVPTSMPFNNSVCLLTLNAVCLMTFTSYCHDVKRGDLAFQLCVTSINTFDINQNIRKTSQVNSELELDS